MKTLSDHLKSQRDAADAIERMFKEKFQKLLDSSASVPLYKSDDTRDVSNYETARKHVRAALAEGRVDLYELACDHCGTQLVNHEPGSTLLSSPPRKRIGCPGCGWIGSIPC